jgi:hypothetical protein
MLGDASDFTPLDLLGSLGLNAASTHFACQDNSLRVGFKMNGEIQPYTDALFIGGLAAALVGQFGPSMARREGHDVATGLLGSFVATETCRMAAQKKKEHWEMVQDQEAAASQQALPDNSQAAAAPKRAKAPAGGKNYGGRGSMNSAYGW